MSQRSTHETDRLSPFVSITVVAVMTVFVLAACVVFKFAVIDPIVFLLKGFDPVNSQSDRLWAIINGPRPVPCDSRWVDSMPVWDCSGSTQIYSYAWDVHHQQVMNTVVWLTFLTIVCVAILIKILRARRQS